MVLLAAGELAHAQVVVGTGASAAGGGGNPDVVVGDSATSAGTGGRNVLIGTSGQVGNWSGSANNNVAIGANVAGGGMQFNTVVGAAASIGVTSNVSSGTILGASAQILSGGSGTL